MVTLKKYRRLCLLGYMIITGIGLYAQSPSNYFGSFDLGDVDFSYNIGVKYVGEYYYFFGMTYESYEDTNSPGTYIIKTDENFNEVARIENPPIFVDNIEVGNYVDEHENYFLILSSNNKENLFKIDKLNLNNFEVEAVDSFYFLDEMRFFWHFAGFINDTTMAYIASEMFYRPTGFQPIENVYLEISTSGKLLTKEFLGLEKPLHIEDAIYLENRDEFFVAADTGDEHFFLFDREMRLIDKAEGWFKYYRDGVGHTQTMYNKYCFVDKSESLIHCVGAIIPWTDEHQVCHVQIPISQEGLDEVKFINPMLEDFDSDLKGNHLRSAVDISNGSLYFVYGPLTQVGIIPSNTDSTTLRIFKSDIDNYRLEENEWYIKYHNGGNFKVWNPGVDRHGNFIITGYYWHEEFFNKTRNFYLKVNSDGTITSSEGSILPGLMVVYPNPTSGPLNVKAEPGDYTEYLVYDMQGQLLKREKTGGSMDFDISDLQSGTYFIHFQDETGKITGNTKVVKY